LFQIIEKFFDTRAAAPPYKPNALSGFGRMLNVPCNVLKDFIQIMKLELVGEYGEMCSYSKFNLYCEVLCFYSGAVEVSIPLGYHITLVGDWCLVF